MIRESGLANDFIIAGGSGYYTLHFALSNADRSAADNGLFLIMEIRDDLPPRESRGVSLQRISVVVPGRDQ